MFREIKESSKNMKKIKENHLAKLYALVKEYYKASTIVIDINNIAT